MRLIRNSSPHAEHPHVHDRRVRTRSILRTLICTLALSFLAFESSGAATKQDGRQFVEQLLARMTLEEKLGQMMQRPGGRSRALNSLLQDPEFERIRRGQVGSYLHVGGAEVLGKVQRIAVEQSRLGIPLLFATDVVHGYRTIFPVPIAVASSFDPQLAEQVARISAIEATASGLHWSFAPMIDISPDPRWGRIVESAGEDPLLMGAMSAAYVRGFQGEDLRRPDTVLATPKHFVAYGAAAGGRDYNSTDVSWATLQNLYLPPFLAAVQAGAATVMSGFNDIGGLPMSAHSPLIRGVLKQDWGFEGLVVSDWEAIHQLRNHGVAGSDAQAALLALRAGIDMEMASSTYESLADAARRDPALMRHIDDAVRRILLAKYALGLFDDPFAYHDPAREKELLLAPAHVAASREIARRSIVLLKNEGNLLPLSRDIGTLLVVGSLATDASTPLGSWRAVGRVEDSVPLLDGIRRAVSDRTTVLHVTGDDISQTVAQARKADAIVLVLGEHYDLSGEGRSRSDITLPGNQQALADAVLATGKPVVVVLVNGRPLAIPELARRAPAILETWMLGMQMGPAVADVLFGTVSPAGRLPATFPQSVGQVPFVYNHHNTGRPPREDDFYTSRYIDLPSEPVFPFGHGLTYTRFEYGELTQSASSIKPDDTLEIAFTLRNTGERDSDEVVQLYTRQPVASLARPVKELKAFRRVHLPAGAQTRVHIDLPATDLAFYGAAGRWSVEPGKIEFFIGSSSADARLTGSFEIVADEPLPVKPSAARVRVDVRDTQYPLIGRITRLDARSAELIPQDARIERLASGFTWAEGPLWLPEEQALLFTDVPRNVIHRWSPQQGLSVFLQPSGFEGEDASHLREPGANGLARAADGALLLADHGSRAIARLDPLTRRKSLLVERFAGKRFNSPNDLAVASDGTIYFTDPPYGLAGLNDSPHKELAVNGVYRLDPSGQVTLLMDDLTFPNGIALSPDERVLYVANSDPRRAIWLSAEIRPDGTLGERKVFHDATARVGEGHQGLPDGMAVDVHGNVFATGPGGVFVFAPDGTLLAIISTGSPIANCAFGDDGSTLYMTSGHLLARVRLSTRGMGFGSPRVRQ